MSFGISLSDFITLPQFALKVYQVCRDGPDEFRDLAREVQSLAIVLENLEIGTGGPCLPEDSMRQLSLLLRSSRSVLEEMDAKMKRFKTNESGRLQKRDLPRWIALNLGSDRNRLVSQTVTLFVFLSSLS